MRIAAIDLGSNSFHMLIANTLGQSFVSILKERMTVQVGKSALVSGRLDPEAIKRGVRCINEFRRLAMTRRVERTLAVATSAIREAENGEEFIHRIGRTTGIAVRVIPGREEARLIYLAVRRNLDFGGKKALLIDIGGGSVELTVADSEKIHFSTSQKLGFLRLHKRCISSDPLSESDRKSLSDILKSSLPDTLAAIRRYYRPEQIIATSGMAMTLLRIIQRRQPGLRKATIVTKSQMAPIMEIALRKTAAQIANMLDMDISRSQYFPIALLCLNALLDEAGFDRFAVSPFSLREGLVYDYLAQNGTQPGTAAEDEYDLGHTSVIDLASRPGYPREHSHKVAQVANQIFEQTRDLHGLGQNKAQVLR